MCLTAWKRPLRSGDDFQGCESPEIIHVDDADSNEQDASCGGDDTGPPGLPVTQRQLFMRIQKTNQKHDEDGDLSESAQDEPANSDLPPAPGICGE